MTVSNRFVIHHSSSSSSSSSTSLPYSSYSSSFSKRVGYPQLLTVRPNTSTFRLSCGLFSLSISSLQKKKNKSAKRSRV